MVTERKNYVSVLGLVLVLMVVLSGHARAELWGFDMITNNTGNTTYADQLAVDVSPAGSQVLFTFYNYNSVPYINDGAIAEIFFDDQLNLLTFASISGDSGAGVNFINDPTPGNLPGLPSFGETDSVICDPTAPVNGVDPGEYVAVLYNIAIGSSYAAVRDALLEGFEGTDTLRIGLHVRGFEGDPGISLSESFVAVPVPGAVLLGLLGMGIAGLKLRKYA